MQKHMVNDMALLNISQAARSSGKDRNTIKRYLKLGHLSASQAENGRVLIDSAELMRVFGHLISNGDANVSSDAAEKSPENNTRIIETLMQQLKAAEEREAWLKSQLELEREHSRELEKRILPPAEKKGFWARIFGN